MAADVRRRRVNRPGAGRDRGRRLEPPDLRGVPRTRANPRRGGGQIKEKLGALAIYTDERTACQGSTWCRSSPGQRGTVGAAALVAAGEVALEASRPQPGGPLTDGRLGAA